MIGGRKVKVLIINSGSSSIKYQVFDMKEEKLLAKGLVERIGIDGSKITHNPIGGEKIVKEVSIPDHKVGIKLLIEALLDDNHGVIKDLNEIEAVGHRVVHGGEKFSGSVLITDEVIEALRENIELAPLHNPPNIWGIEACQELMSNVPHVGVFDTAFHATIPDYAYTYALPYEYYEKYKIRRYGFHGTSHRYVSKRVADIIGKPVEELKIITLHMGNGVSFAAIKNGKSVETTMGFTPLEGMVMGTRSGDIDPAIVTYLMEKENLSTKDIYNILNKKSGLLGISGISNDMRDIQTEKEKGNYRAKLAIEVFVHRAKKYIGAYAAIMGGLDILVFTAGIGENDHLIRRDVCKGLEFLGIEFNDEVNDRVRAEEALLTKPDSRVKVFLIPTNEELMIARDTKEIVDNLKK